MFDIDKFFYMCTAVLSPLGMIVAVSFAGNSVFGPLGSVVGIIVGGLIGIIPFTYFYKRLMKTPATYNRGHPIPPDAW